MSINLMQSISNMKVKAFQDYYPDDMAHCYGCGYLNERGHQIKTYWDGDETLTHFTWNSS